MKNIGMNQLREMYLQFFESKGHMRMPSFSLVPQNDPSILLINAGMTPLKPYFTGAAAPPRARVTTCQKCLRTVDIENAGKTARHGTFFEMLGNFSFGDYFKKEAIQWAWEFLAGVLELPVDKLWVSVYEEDDEAYGIWRDMIGLPAGRIVRLGKKDNFWEHGTGPCGPSSEIHYDRGPDKGCGKPDCAVGCDCDRFMEVWNLVFTQFNREEDGSYTRLEKKNIDTGMGLERLGCVVQGVNNLFEVDTNRRILDAVCKVAGAAYGDSLKADVSIRVITDHIKGTVMMISDGVLPSNEGRGYVLRRLLRRAARHGRLLGIEGPFLTDIARVAVGESKDAYPELADKAEYIMKVISIEEERFSRTIDQGLSILQEYVEKVKSDGSGSISGGTAFKLHDTYGFPLDLTKEIAQENGLAVDEKAFADEMSQQRKKAREALKSKGGSAWTDDAYALPDKSLKTEFIGYGAIESDCSIVYILKDGQLVDGIQEGDEAVLVLDKTVFYAESGGQTGDTGVITAPMGVFKVTGCKKTADGKTIHMGIVESGIIENCSAKAFIDRERRLATARNHTATHLLHKALRNVLGGHVNQSGSLVEPDRLRFDFTHFASIPHEDLKRVENEVNSRILDGIDVLTEELSLDEAKKKGATALFGEKYGDRVRVVSIGGYSMELCGGTHLGNTAQAGLFRISGEGGVAAGVRRIEAVTGSGAIGYVNEQEKMFDEAATALKTNRADVLRRINALLDENRDLNKKNSEFEKNRVKDYVEDIRRSNAVDIKGIKVMTKFLTDMDTEYVRNLNDMIKIELGTDAYVIVLDNVNKDSGKVNSFVTASGSAIEMGVSAVDIIKGMTLIAGGGGGGRKDMAQSGGMDASKIDETFKYVITAVEKQIK